MKETQWERAEDCPEDALEQARQQEDALFAQALEKQQRKAEAPYSLSLIHISEPTRRVESRMPSSA